MPAPTIRRGSIVQTTGDTFISLNFSSYQGTVVRVSGHGNKDSISVFFDREVPDRLFTNPAAARAWDKGVPKGKDTGTCPRVVCFHITEVYRILPRGVDVAIILRQIFERDSINFVETCTSPVHYDLHACHIASCTQGVVQTRTFVRSGRVVRQLYTCKRCHKKYNGKDEGSLRHTVDLKSPLPGAFSIDAFRG